MKTTGATAATLAAVAGIPRPLMAHLGGSHAEPVPPVDDPRLKALAARALDAARAAGAGYADTRLTHTWYRDYSPISVVDREYLTVGVRALVNGYWGFAAGPVWSPDEMARLGGEAVHQAKANALGKPRAVELAPAPAVPDGHWVMPVKIDPFEVSPFEIMDFLQSLLVFADRFGAELNGPGCNLHKQEKAFASTAGSYLTQRTYRTGSGVIVHFYLDRVVDLLSPAGVGWELFREQPIQEEIRRLFEDIKEDLKLPVKPVEVGRYDAVVDAKSLATLLHETLGPATELDRALGYEANAGGTSYINAPFDMVGTYQAGAPLLTVTGNRGEPGGCATVKWDDEGVQPEDFALVKQGVLTDFQTTRESAGWLKDYYVKAGRPLRSHGCAAAPAAEHVPLSHAPNLAMAPGAEALDFEDLVAGLTKGIAIKAMTVDMDFQHSSGLGLGPFYEVKNGKRVARIATPGVLFRSTELWKGLLAVGGKSSLRRFGLRATKGEPEQEHYASVTAPSAVLKQLTLVDPLRKA